MIIYNCNFPPVEDLKNPTKVNKKLLDAAKALEIAGAELIAIPSNNPHIFYDEISAAVNIPVIDLRKEVLKVIQKSQAKKVGILTTEVSFLNKLYQKFLDDANIENVCYGDDSKKIQEAAINYMNGNLTAEDRKNVDNAIHRLKKGNVDKIILACTELPLILNNNFDKNFFIDTLDALVDATMREIS